MVGAALLAAPGAASAVQLYEGSGAKVSVVGVAEAGVMLEASSGEERALPALGPRLNIARLNTRARHEGVGDVHIQFDASRGSVRLLDASVGVTPWEPLELRMGLFKTPVGAEFDIGLPKLALPRRTPLTGLLVRRLVGAQIGLHLRGTHVSLETETGLFQPAKVGISETRGMVLAHGTTLGLMEALDVKAGYTQLVFDDNALADAPDTRVLPRNRQLDLAVVGTLDRFSGHLEGLVVLDGPGGAREWGGFAQLSYLTRTPSRSTLPALEPAVALHGIDEADASPMARTSAALNAHWAAASSTVRLAYEAAFHDAIIHPGLLPLAQARF